MSFKNEDKIMDFLTQNKDIEFKVTEIAEKLKIDIKNMGRYLKSLEEQQRIKVRPVQEGKVRTKFISFAEPTKPKQPSPPPSPEPLPSPPEPIAKSQVQGPTPAAELKNEILNLNSEIAGLEARNAELEIAITKKDKLLTEIKSQKQPAQAIEEFDDMVKFCFKNIEDADCQTFLAHNLPPRQERSLTEEQRLKLGITEIRKGGGHSGATKIALTILRKMRNQ